MQTELGSFSPMLFRSEDAKASYRYIATKNLTGRDNETEECSCV